MDENPYAPPKADISPAPELPMPDELRAIAGYQRWLQFCVLGHLASFIAVAFLSVTEGPEKILILVFIATYWIATIAGAVCAIFLAGRVDNIFAAILFGPFFLLPCVNTLGLLVVNYRATSRLIEYQIPIGLLGADLDALENRIRELWPHDRQQLPPTP